MSAPPCEQARLAQGRTWLACTRSGPSRFAQAKGGRHRGLGRAGEGGTRALWGGGRWGRSDWWADQDQEGDGTGLGNLGYILTPFPSSLSITLAQICVAPLRWLLPRKG